MEFLNQSLPALSPADKQFHDQYVIIQVGNTAEQLTRIKQLYCNLRDLLSVDINLQNNNNNNGDNDNGGDNNNQVVIPENPDDLQLNEDEIKRVRRFLVARAWIVADAEEMFRSERKWREESFPRTIRSETLYRFLFFRNTEVFPHIRDRYNRPLVVMTGARYNPSINLKDNDQMADYFIWQMEILRRIVKGPQSQFVLILDLNNWGMRSFDYGMAQTLAGIAKPYYPDYMGATFIINYPFVMWGVWKLAGVLIEQRTKDKIQFLSKNDYMKLFPLMFGKDNIYERFGGTKKEDAVPDEWDKNQLKEWNTIKTKPLPEQETFFSEKLNDLFEKNPQLKHPWQPLQNTANINEVFPDN